MYLFFSIALIMDQAGMASNMTGSVISDVECGLGSMISVVCVERDFVKSFRRG